MPSRFTFHATADDITSSYPIDKVDIELYKYYNLKPTNRATGIIYDGSYKLTRLRWGFVKGNQFFKARAESIHEKKMFSKAFRERRCVILANGFFEWDKEQKGTSIPYYFTLKNSPLFSIAGVYSSYEDEEDKEKKYRFAVITTDANEVVRKVFHRMPSIISQDKFKAWMDPNTSQETLLKMLQPIEAEEMDSWQVDPLPSRGDNGPDTIKPAGNSGLSEFF